MPTLAYTWGLPGSGKTRAARDWVAENPAARARVNRDDFRDMLHGGWLGTEAQEQTVTAAQHDTIRVLLGAGLDVVVDDTNLVPEHRAALEQLAADCGATVEVWDLTAVPVETCLDRNNSRPPDQQVPEQAIWNMAIRHGLHPVAWLTVDHAGRVTGDSTITVGEWTWPLPQRCTRGTVLARRRIAETLHQNGWRIVPDVEDIHRRPGEVGIPIEPIKED